MLFWAASPPVCLALMTVAMCTFRSSPVGEWARQRRKSTIMNTVVTCSSCTCGSKFYAGFETSVAPSTCRCWDAKRVSNHDVNAGWGPNTHAISGVRGAVFSFEIWLAFSDDDDDAAAFRVGCGAVPLVRHALTPRHLSQRVLAPT